MRVFTKEHAKLVLDWYDKEGQCNWGGWGHYPKLPSSARYHSFEDCHLRILFDDDLQLENAEEDETFNCISDSRRVPGKQVHDVVSIYQLRDYILSDEEKLLKRIEGWKSDWKRTNDLKIQQEQYEKQSDDIKNIIAELQKEHTNILGTVGSKAKRKEIELELSKYIMPFEVQSWTIWITKAWEFNNEEEYVNYKKMEDNL